MNFEDYLYPSGMNTWITIENKEIPYKDLDDQHLRNCLKMLDKRTIKISATDDHIADLCMEELYRSVVELLKKDHTQLVLWLTSDNPLMRSIAGRCK